ncbi:MAG TPA: hypothetical protein VHH35_10840, partial [Pyrinomonadaceae bacterium]|nr:hypothetical protein [Pyrinomonadaceae bacterium]
MKRNLTLLILSKDAAEGREMTRAFSGHSSVSVLMTSDDAEQIFTETLRLRPSAVVINLGHMGEPALKLVQRMAAECQATAVVCASRE